MKLPDSQYDSIISALQDVIAYKEGKIALDVTVVDTKTGEVKNLGKQFVGQRASPSEVFPMRKAIIHMRLSQALQTLKEHLLSLFQRRDKL